MAADATLSVAVVAEIEGFKSGFNQVGVSIGDLQRKILAYKDIVANSLDTKVIAKYNAMIEVTSMELTKLQRIGKQGFDSMGNAVLASGQKIAKGSNQAGMALIDLGRIAQDVPYGFMGIANNVNPAVESFGRLRAELGSSTAAFKAMAGQLIGVGGLGLAVSVISSAILFYQQYQQKAKKATEEGSEANKKYQETLDSISESASKEIAKITILYDASQNLNIPLSERKKLVDELQKQYPSYFKNLSDEAILAGRAESAYNALTQSLINNAIAKGGEDVIASKVKELASSLIAFQEQQRKFSEKTGGKGFLSKNNSFVVDKNGDLETLAAYEDRIKKEISDTRKSIQGALGNFSAADIIGNFDAKEVKPKKVKTIEDILKALSIDLKQVQNDETLDPFGKINKSIEGYKTAINDLTKIDSPAAASKIKDLQDSVYGLRQELFKIEGNKFAANLDSISRANVAAQDVAKLAKEIRDLDESLVQLDKQQDRELDSMIFRSGKSDIKLQTESIKSQIEEQRNLYKQGLVNAEQFQNNYADIIAEGKVLTALLELEDGIKTILSDNIGSAFGDLGSSIGEALATGGDVLSAAGNSVIESFGQFLGQIGDLLIEYGIAAQVKAALDKAIAIPGAGIIAGAAAIAAGVALKAAAGAFSNIGKGNSGSKEEKSTYRSIPGFATGVTNFSGGLAIVGEKGPELVNLPPGSDVIANNRIGQYMQGNNTNITLAGNLAVSGDQLVFLIDRTRSRQKRLG